MISYSYSPKMSEENSDSENIPGITIPLAKIVPKRCSSRKRAPPNFYVPTHFRPSPRLHGHGLRRGPGRPPKQTSDAPSTDTTRSPASQPLRRGTGRPRKQRSVVPTMAATQSPASHTLRRRPGRPGKQQSDAPAVSPPPASPSGSTGDSPLQIPSGSTGDSPLQISATTSTPEAVAPTPLGSTSDRRTPEAVAPSSLRSTSDRPLEVLSGEEETKLNVKLSRILMHPPKTNHSPQILDEESKKVILKVESLLVKKLLNSANGVEYMVHQANITFRYLKGLGVDYASFYRDVAEHIKYRCDLQDTEKEETMLSLSALQKRYENDILSVKDVEEDLSRTQGEWEIANDKKKALKRQIKDLKTEVARIEHEEEHLKHDEIKYKEAHEVAKAKMQELGTQLKAAQAKQREIEQRKDAALRGIESTTRHLQSTFLDDLN